MSARRILAVDDSRTMRTMVSHTLHAAGFEVAVAEDGAAALESLERDVDHGFDLIITDLNMPRMDGLALVRAVRADTRHRATPILILTTESAPEKKAEGRAAGATGWLVKPFHPERLVDLVYRVCP